MSTAAIAAPRSSRNADVRRVEKEADAAGRELLLLQQRLQQRTTELAATRASYDSACKRLAEGDVTAQPELVRAEMQEQESEIAGLRSLIAERQPAVDRMYREIHARQEAVAAAKVKAEEKRLEDALVDARLAIESAQRAVAAAYQQFEEAQKRLDAHRIRNFQFAEQKRRFGVAG